MAIVVPLFRPHRYEIIRVPKKTHVRCGMTTKEFRDAYEQWLSGFRWDWFATLTFRGTPTRGRAERLFREWIEKLKLTQGTQNFDWFRVTESGSDGDNLHFHVLICGLRSSNLLPAYRRWEQRAGEPCIENYRSEEGAIRYILKTVHPGGRDLQVDFSSLPTNRRSQSNTKIQSKQNTVSRSRYQTRRRSL